jgi:hypothetical protein
MAEQVSIRTEWRREFDNTKMEEKMKLKVKIKSKKIQKIYIHIHMYI